MVLPMAQTHRGSMSVRVCACVCVWGGGGGMFCEDGGTEDDNHCDATEGGALFEPGEETESDEEKKKNASALN